MKKTKSTMLLIVLPKTMHTAIKKEAKRQDRSMAAFMRMMIKEKLQLN